MTILDLRSWLRRVDELGELRNIEGANWQEEIGAIAHMLMRANGSPATMFDDVPGYPSGYRILVNSLGSLPRIGLTLGLPVDLDAQQMMARWQNKSDNAKPIPPVFVDDGPVMENVMMGDDVNVLKFPVPHWHPEDGGRYIGTASGDISREPDEGWVNMGTYRVMVHDEKRVAYYMSPGKQGRIQREKYFARGEQCPVAVAIGMPPLLYIASTSHLEYGLSEYDWAGGIAGEPVRVIKGKVTGLPIPADAEIVLEGFSSPNEGMQEGPFGEWTGYYASGARNEPYIDVKAIYHRNNPIITGSPPNKPPMEMSWHDAFIRSAAIRRYVERAGVPDVTGVWSHPVGGRFFLTISIKQRYPGHARQALHVAAMCHAGAYLGRYVIVVDEDIDVTDLNDVIWAICTRADPERSLDIIKRAWSGPLDPAIHPDHKGFSSRLLIDACRPYEWRDRFPHVNAPDPEVKRRVAEKWGYLLNGK